ncbi:regulator of chromosome condensation [Vairimorpha necatrix]|uniref:Regulator of chromosome condensation n=1 Tax=Vairimorpha necatrix TaxID=6039 RepID=A0AAX4JGP2_9MICR
MPVYVFGSNATAQLGLGEHEDSTHIPKLLDFFNNKKVIKIHCGTIHTLALTDSALYSWGCNDEYALGREGDESIPLEVEIPYPVIDISCGASISVCLTSNHYIYVWGTFRDFNGVFGLDENTKIQKKPKKIKINFTNFKTTNVHCGANFIMLLNNDKSVWTFGSNEFNELGRRTSERFKESSLFPNQIFNLRNKTQNYKIKKIRSGMHHGMAINENNEVYTWGSNIYGQLGIGHDKITKMKHLIDLEDVEDCTGGEHHSLFLCKDKLYGSGKNDEGQLGLKNKKKCFEPEFIMENVSKVRSYQNFSIVQVGNDLYSFGMTFNGATGYEDIEIFEPKKIPFEFGEIEDFSVGSNFTIVITK